MGVQSIWINDALIIAQHAGAHHANVANRGVQSTSFGPSAAVPLVAVESGSVVEQRIDDDVRVNRQYARRASRRSD